MAVVQGLRTPRAPLHRVRDEALPGPCCDLVDETTYATAGPRDGALPARPLGELVEELKAFACKRAAEDEHFEEAARLRDRIGPRSSARSSASRSWADRTPPTGMSSAWRGRAARSRSTCCTCARARVDRYPGLWTSRMSVIDDGALMELLPLVSTTAWEPRRDRCPAESSGSDRPVDGRCGARRSGCLQNTRSHAV